MPSRSFFLTALLPMALLSAQDVTLPTHPLEDSSAGSLVLDQAAIREASATTAPFSVWFDPAFAQQRQHITEQLGLLFTGNVPPFDDLARDVDRFFIAMAYSEPESGGRFPTFAPRLGMSLDLAGSKDAFATWWRQSADKGDTATLAGLSGHTTADGTYFGGFDGDRFYFGSQPLVTALAGAEELPTSPAPIVSAMDLGPFFDALAELTAVDSESAAVTELLFGPDWHGHRQSVRASTTSAGPAGWQSNVIFTGLGTLASGHLPSAGARLLPEADVAMAWAWDQERLHDINARILAAADDASHPFYHMGRAWQDMAGAMDVDAAAIPQALSGHITASIKWSDRAPMIPATLIVIGLEDPLQVTTWVQSLLADAKTVDSDIPGADQAWTVALPMANAVVAIGSDALVLASTPPIAESAFAEQATDVPWPEAASLYLEADLRSIASRWLPLVWAQAQGLDEPMGMEPLQSLKMVTYSLPHELRENPPAADSSVSSVLLQSDRADWVRGQLAAVYPQGDLDQQIDTHLAIWQSQNDDTIPKDIAVILRTPDRFISLSDGDQNTHADLAALQQDLPGFQLLVGPAAEELAVTVLPEQARFSGAWLPELDLLVSHLPPKHRIVLQGDDQTLHMEETGLPLLGIYGHVIGLYAPLTVQGLHWQIRREKGRQQKAELAQRHADVIEALEALGQTVRRFRHDGLPERASELVAASDIDLAVTAPLFGGTVPSDVAAFDRVGRWDPQPDGWPEAVWAVHLEPGWAAYISSWGEVEVTNELEPVEPTPADAATGGDPDSLF